MKLSIVLTLAVATLTTAQDGLPDCAKTCADQFLAGGIGNCGRDPKCICADKAFLGNIACCLVNQAKPCTADEQKAVIDYAQQLCKANGVDVPSTISCASTTSGGASTTAASTSGSAAATTTGASTTASGSTSATHNYAPRQTAAAGIIGGLVAAVAML